MAGRINDKFLDLCFYQIYPRSFFDSNNDGIGDLNGITLKLDYLKNLGINAIWLSPCYKSPNDDNGYDISDYRDIMDEFGTLEDFKNMIAGMHKKGIKLIMDFVANHTSSEHFWFKEARKSRDNKYRNYYYWADKPLNDWESCFGGSAWQYDGLTNQYYLHSYAVSQPDLNWENPQVRKEMKSVVDYWVDLGVDGFRCDVLDQISKDFVNNLNGGGPDLHRYIRQLFGRKKTENIFTVGECWGAKAENIDAFCGQDRKELTTVFQFEHICLDRNDRFVALPYNLNMLKGVLVKWQNYMQKSNLLYSIFTENHDQPRMISRYGDNINFRYENATMVAVMFYLLKGIPFIYQGQEIGITNSVNGRISDFDDIESVNYYKSMKGKIPEAELMANINFGSRDNARRPMPWSGEKYCGFSESKPWIAEYNLYKEINVSKDMESKKSVYKFYRDLLALRKDNKEVVCGAFKDITAENKNCFIYKRMSGKIELTVVCNFDADNEISAGYGKGYELILSNYENADSDISRTYRPYEACVYKKVLNKNKENQKNKMR